MTEERERWYHPSVGGMVKEVYRRDPVRFLTWSRPGYTATSTLMAYGKAEVEPEHWSEAPADVETDDRREPVPSPASATRSRSRGLILAGVVVFTASDLVLVRRIGRGRGHRGL